MRIPYRVISDSSSNGAIDNSRLGLRLRGAAAAKRCVETNEAGS